MILPFGCRRLPAGKTAAGKIAPGVQDSP